MTRLRPLLLVLSAFGLVTTAAASPLGSSYDVTVVNFGGAAGPVFDTATFDGIAEPISGTSLSLSESSAPLPGGEELLEFWISSATAFADGVNPAGHSVLGLGPIDWGGIPGQTVAGSGFVYFTVDGVPVAASDALGLLPAGFGFAPHPLDPGLEVLYVPSPPASPVLVGADTSLFGATYPLLESVLGIAGLGVNDLHIGVSVSHAVPEPASGFLLAPAVLAALRRRRRVPAPPA